MTERTGTRRMDVASDAEFLRWVAAWLDRVDPILRAVFTTSSSLTEDQRSRLVEWVSSSDAQDRLRRIADSHEEA